MARRVVWVGSLMLLALLCLGGGVAGGWWLAARGATASAGLPTPAAPPATASAPSAGSAPASPSAPATAPVPAQAPAPPGRIAVLTEGGNIVTVDSQGGDLRALTNDASAARLYRYPTWSPDGQALAFVELDIAGEEAGRSALHVVADEGSARRISTEFPPFYLFWSPTGEALAFLSSGGDEGMALRLLDVANAAPAPTTLSEGQPFYFSWEPGGQRLFAHIGGDELAFLSVAGQREPLATRGGLFQAPDWSADGQQLAFVAAAPDGDSELRISAADGSAARTLAQERGLFSFNWSPDSRQIAYSYTEQSVGLAAFGPLWLEDTVTGSRRELSAEPVVGFFWSPDGRALAFLRPDFQQDEEAPRGPQAAPLRQEATRLWLRWHIWDGERTYPLARFRPSRSFVADYLRYFDQYAQSISLWSPDGSTLLYVGHDESEQAGLWVLPVAPGSLPTRILPGGELAAWSPR